MARRHKCTKPRSCRTRIVSPRGYSTIRRRRRPTGKYGRSVNPFFNFLSTLKNEYKGLPAKVLTVEGGKIWRTMDCNQKQPYITAASEAQRRRVADMEMPFEKSR